MKVTFQIETANKKEAAQIAGLLAGLAEPKGTKVSKDDTVSLPGTQPETQIQVGINPDLINFKNDEPEDSPEADATVEAVQTLIPQIIIPVEPTVPDAKPEPVVLGTDGGSTVSLKDAVALARKLITGGKTSKLPQSSKALGFLQSRSFLKIR